uniref:Uncharacterized protein n=1 Tax=Nelumbo nucifera TaxID=4432 RepID=A0A822XMS5_NELNU|nr:TPA_asm: hypothetical protein HUJ06_021964 [Nelumbo nucifera]
MAQGYGVELYFKAWNVLARRQISTQLIEMESRPHITLSSSPTLEPPKLENVMKNSLLSNNRCLCHFLL